MLSISVCICCRLKFGRVDDLLSQRKTVGQVAYLKDSHRFIFYLVTKQRYFNKPTEYTLHASLLDLRDKCKTLGVTKLAMPRIGCGLDGLKWPLVFHLVQEVFGNCGMEITIYSVPDKRKSMTPSLNRTQDHFRKFRSLPASKRRFDSYSVEEDCETPKRRKIMKSSPYNPNVDDPGVYSCSPLKKMSSTDRKPENSSLVNHRKEELECVLDPEVLRSFSEDCPFSPIIKKRNSLPTSQTNNFESSTVSRIPFLHEDESSRTQNLGSEPESAVYSNKISTRESKYSCYSDKNSTSVKEGRKLNFTLSDQEEEVNEDSLRMSPERISPNKEIKVRSPASSRKERRRSSSKNRSEEKVRKEKRRSSSQSGVEEKIKKEKRRSSSKSCSGEKIKKEKRRSSSKSRSEEKIKEEKRRSSSKSHSEEKIKEEKRKSSSRSHSEEKHRKDKRRSSKSHSEEKLKKDRRRTSDSWVKQPLDSYPSESSLIQAKVNLVSKRFPSCNKERPSRDLSSSSDESVIIEPKCLNGQYQREDCNHSQSKSSLDLSSGDEDKIKESKSGALVSPEKAHGIQPSHHHSRSVGKTNEDRSMLVRKSLDSTDINHLSNELKVRLGEIVKTPHKDVDDSLQRKMKKTPDSQSFNTPRKTLKSPIGKLYSDKETPSISVKARLSLNRKP